MDTLYFSGVPQVHILEEKYSVNYGNDITLYCTVNAVPDYTKVKWTKTKGGSVTDINPATPPGKYSGASVTSPSLVINNVNLDDGASYICTATNQIGTGTSSSTVLNVVGGMKYTIGNKLKHYGRDFCLFCTQFSK